MSEREYVVRYRTAWVEMTARVTTDVPVSRAQRRARGRALARVRAQFRRAGRSWSHIEPSKHLIHHGRKP